MKQFILAWILLILMITQYGPWAVTATVVSNTTRINEGIFRYHYDSHIPSCSFVSLIGVGTTMKVEDYDRLSREIATGKPAGGIISIVLDHAPGNPIKISAKRFSLLANVMAAKIGEFIPVCRDQSSGPPKIVVGGHSASGGAAMKSLQSLNFSPAGFIGLSPFRITDDLGHIKIPSLSWGFSTATCGADVEHAAAEAYALSNDDGRVLYQLQNPSKEPSHCIFANNGCLPICPSSRAKDFAWIRPAVGESVNIFFLALKTHTFTRDSFELSLPKHVTSQDLKMFVNRDKIDAIVDTPPGCRLESCG